MYSKIMILGVVSLFWAGCVTDRSKAAFPESSPLGADLPVFRPSAKIEKQIEIEEPFGAVTLRQALALALIRNPELMAFAWEIRAREAATLQAGLFQNLSLGADLQGLGGSASKETTLTLSQIIELGGKRTLRRDAAAFSRDLAGWNYEAKRIELFTQVSQSFTNLLKAQQQGALTEETIRLAYETARVVSERVKAGKVSPIEEIRANVALASAGIERDRAEKELETARQRLATTWGSTIPKFDKAEGTLGPVSPIPSFEQLAERLFQNPELSRWVTEIAQRRAVIDLAQSQAIPDLTVLGGFRRYETTGDNVFIVGISIPLPIFNKNQGAIQESRYRLAKGEEEKRGTEVRVTAALSEAYGALSTAYVEATSLAENLLPGAMQVFDAVNEGYRLGKFGLLDLLDAQRTLFVARARHLDALANYHHAVAEVEQLIGEPLKDGDQWPKVRDR
jgi:cobalt-zinc-cadmium efflux system outer membrane protein